MIQTLGPTGPVVGVYEASEWAERPIVIEPRDRLVLFTDGLAETASPDGEMFGRERLQALLVKGGHGRLDESVEQVTRGVEAYRASGPQADDLTLLAVEFRDTS